MSHESDLTAGVCSESVSGPAVRRPTDDASSVCFSH